MFSTSSLYFLVAIFGESIESSEARALQLVEGQKNETTESATRYKKKHLIMKHLKINAGF